MLLLKSAGATYPTVAACAVHAFYGRPVHVRGDEFVLLSKNREDCDRREEQVQYAAKLGGVRPAGKAELERLFPGVGAASRRTHLVDLYWVRRLAKPFSLDSVPGCNARRYGPAQRGFAWLQEADATAVFRYLVKTNHSTLLDFSNNAQRPQLGH